MLWNVSLRLNWCFRKSVKYMIATIVLTTYIQSSVCHSIHLFCMEIIQMCISCFNGFVRDKVEFYFMCFTYPHEFIFIMCLVCRIDWSCNYFSNIVRLCLSTLFWLKHDFMYLSDYMFPLQRTVVTDKQLTYIVYSDFK